MLLAAANIFRIKLYDQHLKTVDLCTLSRQARNGLVDRLVKQNVVLEGAPYPASNKYRRDTRDYTARNIVVFGDTKGGKDSFVRQLRDSQREAYLSAVSEEGASDGQAGLIRVR